jgi:hypothetical protein
MHLGLHLLCIMEHIFLFLVLMYTWQNPDPQMCLQMAATVASPSHHSSKGTHAPITPPYILHSSTVRALPATSPHLWQTTAASGHAYVTVPNSTGPASELLSLAETLLAIPNSSIPTSAATEASPAAAVEAALTPPHQQHTMELHEGTTAAPTATPVNTTCTVHEAPTVPTLAASVPMPAPKAESAPSAAPAQMCLVFQPLVECPAGVPAVKATPCACDYSATCGKTNGPHQLWVEIAASKLVVVEKALRKFLADAAAWVQHTTAYTMVSYI